MLDSLGKYGLPKMLDSLGKKNYLKNRASDIAKKNDLEPPLCI